MAADINREESSLGKQYESLLKRIEALESNLKQNQATPNGSRSEELKDLFSALAKAQAEMQTAGLNAENPYFKSSYADLAEVVRVSRPSLAKNGLSVIQQVLPNDDGQNILHTILAHNSGQWIESRMRILPSKPDVQSLASYITYIRRYAYAALVGVTVSAEDDDAEREVATQREVFAKGVAINQQFAKKNEGYETISSDQLAMLEDELKGFSDIAELVLEGLKIQNLSDMKKEVFSNSIKRIREIKHARKQQ